MNDALLSRGVALERAGKPEEAARVYAEILKSQPRHFGALYQLANLEFMAGRFDRAEALYASAANVNPASADAHFGRGCALQRMNRHGDAVAAYDKALALSPKDAEAWSNRGAALQELKRAPEALQSFERALAAVPGHLHAWFNRGTTLIAMRRYGEAIQSFDKVLKADPRHVESLINRGMALTGDARREEALAEFGKALAIDLTRADALSNRAALLFELARYGEAAEDAEKLIAISPFHPYVKGLLLRARLHCCDWRDLDRQVHGIEADIAAGKRAIQPFALLSVRDSPELQLRAAEIHAVEAAPPAPAIWKGKKYKHDRIRIAYLSADFSAHATAHLMAGVFEHHDKARFETMALSYGRDDKSPMRARLRQAFGRFIDAAALPDNEAAAIIAKDEIDIAIDLKGYTQEARPGLLAYRPAPVTAQYLGYPGTMGTPSMDYVIADRVVIPKESERFYSEAVVCLPDSYQCNDRSRARPQNRLSRQQAGLPEQGFVFSCFNNAYKIMPEMLSLWMRLLGAIEGSVLWLLEDNAAATRNLRREAEARGISGQRLVFAPKLAPEAHLARHRLAGLFLDTLPYGAHTTASDALWMGLPLVTCLGQAFPGRVAASLLNAVHMPELIAPTLAEYEVLALRLARDPVLLGSFKSRLEAGYKSLPLFNTSRFTRGLEAAYVRIWEKSQRGERPSGFEIELHP
jgi:protein O-GlcNAc transferase